MRVSRIFLDQPLSQSARLVLEGEAAHYPLRVLRLRPGDTLRFFNDTDGEFLAEVVEAGKQQLEVHLLEPIANDANPSLRIHLGLGLSRGERMDWAIQKATELGAGQITPLVTAYSEVRLEGKRLQNRLRHWRGVAVSAAEQSGRSSVPPVAEPVSLQTWLSACPAGIMLDQRGDTTLSSFTPDAQGINLLVGPEGGFDEAEVAAARGQGYRVICLGPRVLRTETAPVAGLVLLQYLFGDLGGA